MVKRNVIFLSVLVLTTMLVGIGVSYSLWNISTSQDTTNMAESKCFDLSISNQENSINLDNAYPISNDNGKSLTPYTFTVTNTCDITAEYSVNLEILKDSTLSSKFVDVMLENNDIKEINLLSNFDKADKVNTSSIESRKLTTGILKSQESKDYSLRLWLDYNTTLEDLNNEIKSFKSKIIVVGKPINFNYAGDIIFNFGYTGGEQTFVAPVSGTYRLETWGAQGGSYNSEFFGGYGGYSTGIIALKNSKNIFINVGGSGNTSLGLSTISNGGYNGGGSGKSSFNNANSFGSGGGGATHIAIKTGLLSTLENSKTDIIIVSGGGAGIYADLALFPYYSPFKIGHAGGYIGNKGVAHTYRDDIYSMSDGGTQIGGYSFGIGNSYSDNAYSETAGGGGGYYGGDNNSYTAGGGSGYIGNPLLTNKAMYCYNCEESNEESTKTISTTCNEETPTSYCAKKGNGYARITLVNIDE